MGSRQPRRRPSASHRGQRKRARDPGLHRRGHHRGGAVYLRRIGDAAPVLDALTTVLSLIAQWLLNRKRIDNWWAWIAADVLYVGLYVRRGLHLTALLYAVFILLCVWGLRRWRRSRTHAAQLRPAAEPA